MEKIQQHRESSAQLMRTIQKRFEQDHGTPGPEDEEFVEELREKGFKITQTHGGEKFAESVEETGFESLSDSERRSLHVLAVAAENYYLGVTIEDPFDAEAQELGLTGPAAIAFATDRRREYQTTMLANPLYRRMESHSKFRLGTITGLWSTLSGVCDAIESRGIDTPQAKALLTLKEKLPPIHSHNFKYTNMTHQEKVKVMEQMDEIAGAVLKLLRPLNEDADTEKVEKSVSGVGIEPTT